VEVDATNHSVTDSLSSSLQVVIRPGHPDTQLNVHNLISGLDAGESGAAERQTALFQMGGTIPSWLSVQPTGGVIGPASKEQIGFGVREEPDPHEQTPAAANLEAASGLKAPSRTSAGAELEDSFSKRRGESGSAGLSCRARLVLRV
ncbi:hypothetical protein CYMTET_34860, partial [Cymbomonas tetramitiformis]